MFKKTTIILLCGLLPLIAQEDFLAGIGAEDLMLDRIEAVPQDIIEEIEDMGSDYWNERILSVVCSPDTTLVAETRNEMPGGRVIGLWIVDSRTNIEKKVVEGAVDDLKWSPSSRYLSFVRLEYVANSADDKLLRKPYFNNDRLCLYDNQTDKTKTIVSTGGLSTRHSWSPLEDYLAISFRQQAEYTLAIYDAENCRNTTVDQLMYCDLWNFSWSPNGRMLAYTKPLKMDKYINEEAPVESEVYVVDYDGSNKKQITNTPESEIYVKWLSDGSRIVTEVVIDPQEYTWDYKYLVLRK